MRAVLWAAALLVAALAAPLRAAPVGLAVRDYADPARQAWGRDGPRPLATVLWYPAPAGTAERDWQVAVFDAGRNARGAPIAAAPVRLPLILLSHGTGGSAPSMAWLAQSLAAAGYLVAAVNHHGNTAAEPEPRLEAQLLWWDRPRDLSVLIDRLLADPEFGPRIDAGRIGVAGFSLGGYTALAAVGARLSQAQWDAHCRRLPGDSPCQLPPEARRFTLEQARQMLAHEPRVQAAQAQMEGPQRDPRIRAAFAMAPVLGPLMTVDSLRAIDVPLQVVVGDRDDQAVPALTAQPVAAAVPGTRLQLLPGVTHYAFLAECTLAGRLIARQVCVDPDGLDRAALHRAVAQQALGFFDRSLGVARP